MTKIREFIERLEEVEKIIKHTPHPNVDNVIFHIHFGDDELDSIDWDIKLEEITFNNRPGCACEENVVIDLDVRKSTN